MKYLICLYDNVFLIMGIPSVIENEMKHEKTRENKINNQIKRD